MEFREKYGNVSVLQGEVVTFKPHTAVFYQSFYLSAIIFFTSFSSVSQIFIFYCSYVDSHLFHMSSYFSYQLQIENI